MNIYLDIDGVILANDKQSANHAEEFLDYITSRYPTYWLTTHCKGDSNYTLQLLGRFLTQRAMECAGQIKATDWGTSKTEAIDFSQPFLWFDDHLFDFEKDDLIKHNATKNWIEVNLSNNPNQLLEIVRDFDFIKLTALQR